MADCEIPYDSDNFNLANLLQAPLLKFKDMRPLIQLLKTLEDRSLEKLRIAKHGKKHFIGA